ncbi:MAG: transposase [Thermoflexaceae bacterium]|nr:transposase [Thermoflexaceae bacterium]
MRFPKKIRRPLDHYAERELRFHLVFNSHPEVGAFAETLRDAIWGAVLIERECGRVELFAACLMPDHLHLLLRPDSADVIRFVNAGSRGQRAWRGTTVTVAAPGSRACGTAPSARPPISTAPWNTSSRTR